VTAALRRIADEGRGVVVVLAGDDSADGLLERLHGSSAADEHAQRQWRRLGGFGIEVDGYENIA